MINGQLRSFLPLKYLFLLSCFFNIIGAVFAQEITISGTVTDGAEPLMGVNVMIDATPNNTITDTNGSYTLSNVDGNAELNFSYVGFAIQNIPVDGRTQIDIALSDDAEAIREEVAERSITSLNNGWKFYKYASAEAADSLIYDVRPKVEDDQDGKAADAEPTKAEAVKKSQNVLKKWIMPTGNKFLSNNRKQYVRPNYEPAPNFSFIQTDFDDSNWESVNLPHDWAINGPFYKGEDAEVGGGMGRLPSPGVAWYRKKITLESSDLNKQIYLEIEGAMSYAMVWFNGKLVGGWPYGYASWQVDLTPYMKKGNNQLAIRLDNPPASSRWYPGGGIYRNVWLTKTNPVHVGQWGTSISSHGISKEAATLDLSLSLDNTSEENVEVEVENKVYGINASGEIEGNMVAAFRRNTILLKPNGTHILKDSLILKNPKLWGPLPSQTPNRYMLVTEIFKNEKRIDQYKTTFGIRSLDFTAAGGVLVNGEKLFIKGVNLHHDLGALGAAFNKKAARRQLAMLLEMGVNAVRLAHNPPAPEFLELTDEMGILVVDEIFDVWKMKKTPLDFHLIFPDWYEQDLRAFIRRDRNHPSIILWSYGNEVGEQYTGESGAQLSRELQQIVKEEDATRPTTVSMNYAKPGMPFTEVPEVINLNYQGEGIRNTPAHAKLKGIRTEPLYGKFHKAFPNKLILSSENAAALSTRDEFILPVQSGMSYPVNDSLGGDSKNMYVNDYGLYAVEFGSSPDKVFDAVDHNPFVGGGFVWSGWDYLGEPSPYYLARSSYFGIIDLAGFKKSRFYQYQARWRPDFKMAHIIPHWNWENKTGKTVPVHVFSAADEAELFLNGKSQGRQKKEAYEYRFRWNNVRYEPGTLSVITYKKGKQWAMDTVFTTGTPAKLELISKDQKLKADGEDLAFVTLMIKDVDGRLVPTADDQIRFEITGPGEIVAADNGNPADLTPFNSHARKALNGKLLIIVRSLANKGSIILKATAKGLETASLILETAKD